MKIAQVFTKTKYILLVKYEKSCADKLMRGRMDTQKVYLLLIRGIPLY